VRKRLFGILVLVIVPILGLGLGIPAAAAGTARAATPERAAHVSGVRVAATPQFLAALKKAREAGRGVAPGPDTPGPNVAVCTYNPVNGSPTQCINDWNGDLTIGAQAARFYHFLNPPGNNFMYFEFVHIIDTASGSGHFEPFADGSGLNTRYNGLPVYELQWERDINGAYFDKGVCIAGDAPYALPYNEKCNTGSSTLYYAWSSYNALISVGASNDLYEAGGGPNQPVWLGSNGEGNTGNGQDIYLTPVQNDNLAWYPYAYPPPSI